MVSWTENQKQAIHTRGGDLLVFASAGTGKTAVLVERVIRLLVEDGVDGERLLMVTFTNAAAAEMKERIRQALIQEIDRAPRATRLQNQLFALEKMFIGTVHSFCAELIRQYFYLVDLDPQTRVASEEEAALLRAEACENLFELRYEEGKADFFTLLDCYGGPRGWQTLQEIVFALYAYAQNALDPQEWLRASASSFFGSPHRKIEEEPWYEDLQKYIRQELGAAKNALSEALALAGAPGGPAAYLPALQKELALLDKISRWCTGTWEDTENALKSAQFPKLKATREKTDPGQKEEVRKLRDAAKKKVFSLRAAIFSRSAGEHQKELAQLAPLMRALTDLALAFTEIYGQLKKERSVMDFNDLEHLALKILSFSPKTGAITSGKDVLRPSEIACQMQNHFVQILVDEYQDINPVQEAILSLVAKENRFLVGDVKQSIYRFRLADPGIFLAKYFSSAEVNTAHKQRKIRLNHNFRTRREPVETLNHIFRQIMTREAGEVDYEDLIACASYPPGDSSSFFSSVVELHLLPAGNTPLEQASNESAFGDFTAGSFEELIAEQQEARFITRQILDITSGRTPFRIWDQKESTYRTISYRDIAVLMRSTVNTTPIFLEEFYKSGIPAYADVSTGYFQATEIETMLSLLKIIDNARQDIPLAGVLRSPLFCLSLDEMVSIRLGYPDGDFYDALEAAFHRGAGATADSREEGAFLTRKDIKINGFTLEKIACFFKLLARWRLISRQNPLSLLIWDIYRQTGYYDFVGGLPGGRERQANLRALLSRAAQYDNTSFRGLPGFLNFIARLQENKRDLGTGRALGENENVVRVMSIHKSKGQEFPVVFVAGLGKQFNLRDLRKDILLHKDLGLGPQYIDLETRVSYPTLPKIALQARLKRETLAEEMRILYVALTRAKEKLILVGSVRNLPNALSRWQKFAFSTGEPSPEASLLSATTPLDWICPALLRDQRTGAAPAVYTPPCWNEQSGKIIPSYPGTRLFLWGGSQKTDFPSPVETSTKKDDLQRRLARLEPVEAGADYDNLIARRLNWVYPYPGANIPAKITATEAKRFLNPPAHDEGPSLALPGLESAGSLSLVRPKFMQAHDKLSATEKGQAVHLALQHLDFFACKTREEIKEQIYVLQQKEILTAVQAAAIEPEQILLFLQSKLGQRCLRARSVTREAPFTLSLQAGEIYPELAGSSEKVLVQGMIDLFFEEGNKLVIIDFKTDRLSPGDSSRLALLVQIYKQQLYLYARALQAITGKTVKEGYLYFLSTGNTVQVFADTL